MIIKIVFSKDSTDVEVCEDATVAMLQEAIEKQMDVPMHKQKLISKGKVMSDKNQLLSQYKVGNASKGQIVAKQQAEIRRQQADKRRQEQKSEASRPNNSAPLSKAADSMPERFKRWKATGVVSLRDLQLKDFPQGFEETLSSLRDSGKPTIVAADIGNNMFQALPGALVMHLTSLKRLRCSHNRITSSAVPWNAFSNLTQLTRLSLDHNCLSILDPCIFQMSMGGHARHIRGTEYGVVAADLALCLFSRFHLHCHMAVSSIETLDVSSNTIENVPEEVRQLQNLVALNLGHNKLRALPEALGECSSLMVLEASTNSISEISESYSRLRALKSLSLANNRVAAVPSAVFNGCTELHALDVRDNPITMQQLRETPGYTKFEDRRKVRLDKIVDAKIGAEFWEAADYEAFHRH